MYGDFVSGVIWRDTARPIRVFMFDAKVLLVLLVWAVHICLETFCVAVVGVLLFGIMELLGLTPKAALLTIKTFLLGRYRQCGIPYFDLRRCIC